MTASDSLRVSNRVNALNGTGVGTTALVGAAPPPLVDVVVPVAERVVPLSEVFALEETLDVELALVSTFVVELAVDAVDNAELGAADVRAVVVLLLVDASVETADVGVAVGRPQYWRK